jgi:hypothetical protein
MQEQREAEIKAHIETKRRSSDASSLAQARPQPQVAAQQIVGGVAVPTTIHPIRRRTSFSQDTDGQQSAQAAAEAQRKQKAEQVRIARELNYALVRNFESNPDGCVDELALAP